MIKVPRISRRGLMASFFCLAAVVSTFATMPADKPNSFSSPNFNFPKTVEKNARGEFEKAMKTGDGLNALKGAIQLDISGSMVSSETYAASIARFDSVAARMGAPYNSLALLLEAALYRDIYASQPWTFNGRVLPSTPVPENVMEWDRNMFVAKVKDLVEKAMENISVASEMPLNGLKPILAGSDDAIKSGFTVADFMTVRAMDILSTFSRSVDSQIPFGNDIKSGAETGALCPANPSPEEMCRSYLDQAIARHENDKDKYILSFFCERKLNSLASRQQRKEYLKHCVELFGETPYNGTFLVDYCREEYDDNPRRQYQLLSEYLEKFPNATMAGTVQSVINSLLQKSLSIEFPKQMIPNREQSLVVKGMNVYDFYVLVYRVPAKNRNDQNVSYAELKNLGKPLHALPVKVEGSSPDLFSTSVDIPGLDAGEYAFVFSTTPDCNGFLEQQTTVRVPKTLVSDITTITSKEDRGKGKELYVVSALNQKPVAGAKVTTWDYKGGTRVKKDIFTTDENGRVSLPNENCNFTVESGANKVEGYAYKNYESQESAGKKYVKILTDLSIYRPGDKVHFAVISYQEKDKKLSLDPNRRLTAYLYDANSQKVDSLQIVTDAQARVNGEFTLPQSGLLGRWQISMHPRNYWQDSESFEVADYKTPKFYVTLDSSSESYTAGDDLKFSGKAMTYSGMPVSDGRVTYSVTYQPVWWRFDSSSASYGGETATNPDGSFTIELPTEGLKNTEYAMGSYILSVSVTDGAGDSAKSRNLSFALGKALNIVSSIGNQEDVTDNSLKAKVAVYDLCSHPVQKKLFYEISKGDKVFKKGEFDAPSFAIDAKDLPSGRYAFRFSLNPEFASNEECKVLTDSVTLWRQEDKVPPLLTQLWVPVTEIVAEPGAKTVKVRFGSSYPDSWILAQFCADNKAGETRWLRVSDGMATVDVDVPDMWHDCYVTFVGTHNLQTASRTVKVVSSESVQSLKIEQETFRDKIEPGSAQSWKFRFSVADKPLKGSAAMAVMSNKALNALEPFSWSFNPYGAIYRYPFMSVDIRNIYNVMSTVSVQKKTSSRPDRWFTAPEWNLYGYSLYEGAQMMYGATRGRLMMSAVKSTAPLASMKETAVTENSLEEESVAADEMATNRPVEEFSAAGATDDSAEVEKSSEVEMREVECPLAFFMPDLTTDSQGVATLSFTAPQFVGTWQLQVLGYTPELKGRVITLDAVSAKAVMAQLNAPRFLRTGDKASVSATLFNNTDDAAQVSGRIEIQDALSGKVLLNKEFVADEVVASGSRVVTAWFDVPTDVDAVILRAYAYLSGNSDGEQTMVPVLPSSTPVTESTPFYLQQDEKDFSVRLPEFSSDSKVTLTYCDNPVWECVTALPSILKPESVNVLSQACALYGNAVAASLFGRYPQLYEGIRQMASPENEGDSTLYSALQRNQSLKNFVLDNTPWVNDAESETLRMWGLLEYGDKDRAAKAVAENMKTILKLQNSDGGWSWCPGMQSSEFITMRVFHVFASLVDMDCLPAGAESSAKKACRYLDNELAADWVRSKRKYIPLTTLLEYLCDKSSFKSIGSTASFKPLEAAAMKELLAKWGDFGICDKATAAILFERRSQPKAARTVLESLRQFASQSREKGMWFDNLKGRWSGDQPLLATSRVLEAFAVIEPKAPEIDQLRQWLVISKQTQNWGDSRCTAAVINSILVSGSDWTVPSQSPVVTLDGSPVDLGRIAAVTGSVTVDLGAAKASNSTLAIERTGVGPAWGGVVARFVAPILDVKADKIPELSIEKSVYAISETAEGRVAGSGDFKVGDKVRVTLTVTCDRDLDYVAIGDARSACLEPVNQLSGYTSSDGVWFYREVRTESTNLFIPFLSKGTHVISYECVVDRAGTYSLGIASAQSQYAPTIAAHSAGAELTCSAK